MTQQVFFLQLPYTVRRKIYVELHIIFPFKISLGGTLVGEWSSHEQRLLPRSSKPVANQLFYVSRDVSEDARRMFYSENRLWFWDNLDCGLRHIKNFSPLAWKSLRYIAISLDSQVCTSMSTCHGRIADLIKKDNKLKTEEDGPIADWKFIVSQLAAHIKEDDQLEIRLVCSAMSRQTAQHFLYPLRSLPLLKNLSVRLGPYEDPELQQMVMDAIKQQTNFFTRRFTPQFLQPFPFLKLPAEIQLRILELSGLVVPDPVIHRYGPWNGFQRFDCRWLTCDLRSDACLGCYCPSTQTAFSTVYPCWGLPKSLFMVSKGIREMAISIFYSMNTLEVEVSGRISRSRHPWTLRSSRFVSGFAEYSWPHLRHIVLKFPWWRDPKNVFRAGTPELEDWTQALKFMSQNFPLERLTLELSLSHPRYAYSEPDDSEMLAIQWGLYDRIVKPMVHLKGLKNLFIRNYWPVDYPRDRIRADKERELECLVMGDSYDSYAHGKKYTMVLPVE